MTKVPVRLKAAVNVPVCVHCGLRIARFVERGHVRPTPTVYSWISRTADGYLASGNFVFVRSKRSSEIKLNATVTIGLTIPPLLPITYIPGNVTCIIAGDVHSRSHYWRSRFGANIVYRLVNFETCLLRRNIYITQKREKEADRHKNIRGDHFFKCIYNWIAILSIRVFSCACPVKIYKIV